jgi:hypothetical protein
MSRRIGQMRSFPAGNDIVLLGDEQGKRDALSTLKQFVKTRGFPAIIFFGKGGKNEAIKVGAGAFMDRRKVRHGALVSAMDELLRAKRRVASTRSLFVGDIASGVQPLIKGYRFLKRLAVSDHSAVYLAEKESADLKVVLKVLRQVPDFSEGIGAFDRFLQEYEMIAELDHPNIVRIYDLGVAKDRNRRPGETRGPVHPANRERVIEPAQRRHPAQGHEARQYHAARRRQHRTDRFRPGQKNVSRGGDDRQRTDPRHSLLHEPGARARA